MLLCEMGHLGYKLIDEDARELGRAGSPMNLWMVLVGRSGSGKSQGFTFAQNLFEDVYDEVAPDEEPSPFLLLQGTDQGIADEITRRWIRDQPPSVLLWHDELMAILKQQGLVTVQSLQRFHDGAGQESHLRTKEVEPLRPGYTTNAIFCMTPSQYEGFTEDMASGGFFSRLTIVSTDHLIQPFRTRSDAHYKSCLDAFADWYNGLITVEHLTEGAPTVLFPSKERRYLQETLVEPLQRQFLDEPNDARDGVIARLAWKTASLAGLYATTTRFKAPYTIEREHVERAIAYMRVTMKHSTEAAERVGVSDFHRLLDTLRKVLRRHPKGIRKSALHHQSGLNGKVDRDTLDKLLATLIDREEADVRQVDTGKRGRQPTLIFPSGGLVDDLNGAIPAP